MMTVFHSIRRSASTGSLDIENFEALEEYLKRTRRIGTEEPPAFQILSGGVSNRVVLVKLSTGEGWVVKQALEKLRVSTEWRCTPERIHREALALSLLAGIAPPDSITPLIFEDLEYYLLAMEAVPSPHANWKALLLAGSIEQSHFEAAGRLLGTIHNRGSHQSPSVYEQFGDTTFFKALRTEPYYIYTASVIPEAAAFFENLVREMSQCALTIVHGDFSPKNILIRNQRLVLLDHEVAHFGDPAFDIGFFLAHILSKAHHLPDHGAEIGEGAMRFWMAYRDAIADLAAQWGLEPRTVRHALGCLLARVAGRSQLEYLSGIERDRQRKAVLSLINQPALTISSLITEFFRSL